MLTLGLERERKSCPVSWGSIKEWPLLPPPSPRGDRLGRAPAPHSPPGAGCGLERGPAGEQQGEQGRQAGHGPPAPRPPQGRGRPRGSMASETGLPGGNRWKGGESVWDGPGDPAPLEGLPPPRLSPTLAFSPEGRPWPGREEVRSPAQDHSLRQLGAKRPGKRGKRDISISGQRRSGCCVRTCPPPKMGPSPLPLNPGMQMLYGAKSVWRVHSLRVLGSLPFQSAPSPLKPFSTSQPTRRGHFSFSSPLLREM